MTTTIIEYHLGLMDEIDNEVRAEFTNVMAQNGDILYMMLLNAEAKTKTKTPFYAIKIRTMVSRAKKGVYPIESQESRKINILIDAFKLLMFDHTAIKAHSHNLLPIWKQIKTLCDRLFGTDYQRFCKETGECLLKIINA